MEAGSLRKKAVRGGLWVFALRAAQQVLTAVRLIVLARLLAPADFGLMGLAALTLVALDVFSETGFQVALIQRRGDIRRYLDAVWTLSIIRGITLFLILYLISPYAAVFFNAPEAESIIKAVGLYPLIIAFANVGIVYFQKELEFDKQFRYQLAGTAADFATSITLALITHNVWALVFGYLAGGIARCLASYALHPYRPKISLDVREVSDLFGFGKWVLGSGILIFLITSGDNIVVGRVLGIAALGFYQMAYLISNTPATEISQVLSQVAFPAYSKLQDSIAHLRQAYLETLKASAMLALPLAAMIYSLAEQFTTLVLGEKWAPMVPALRVLCLFGAVRAINSTIGSLLQSIGKPKVIAQVSSIQLALMALLIVPLTQGYGILGTAVAVTIPNIFTIAFLTRKVCKEIGTTAGTFIKTILPAAAGSLTICLLTAVILSVDSGMTGTVLSVLAGSLWYFIIIYRFEKKAYMIMKHSIIDAARGGRL